MATKLDLAHLMRLRLIVARFGEMDLARWWNTKGMLGRTGAIVLQRGFPQTFAFAQAKVVFAVAKSRCHDLFNSPNCITRWNLPSEIEDCFEQEWYHWLEATGEWEQFFQSLRESKANDLLTLLEQTCLLRDDHRKAVLSYRHSSDVKAFPLPGIFELNDETVTLLAAGFSRGETGNPVIPYVRLGG